MRLVIQRVCKASVTINDDVVASIGRGILVLVGFGAQDAFPSAARGIDAVLTKMLSLRIFADDAGHMNKTLKDAEGGILLVSQFTLYADCRKGRRPSFHLACPPEKAENLYHSLCAKVKLLHSGPVESGVFATNMAVTLVNDGPVTILLDSTDF